MSEAQNSLSISIGVELDRFIAGMRTLREQYTQTTRGLGEDSKQTADAIDQAFRVLGVKGVQTVEAEVQRLQQALAMIRSAPDVLPADKAAAVAAFNARLAELRPVADGAVEATRRLEGSSDGAAASIAQATHKAAAWTAALLGINSATDVARTLVETGSQFENLRVRLDNLLGSTEKADAAFNMIKKLAATTPFEVTALTESFVKLTAFGMQPTEAQMRSLSDVAANLGGGTETLSRVTLALGQAWTKSKLQGQEIMQLAEAGVPVWDALATATGRSVPELQKMSEAGQLGRDVIAKLIDELGRMNAGASDKLMATYAGAVSNAKDALAEFFDLVSRSGVLDYLTTKVQQLLAEFDRMKASGELEARAKAIADAFVTTATAIESAINAARTVGPVLLKLVEVATALKAASIATTFYEATAAMAGLRAASVTTTAALAGTAAQSTATGAAMAGAAAQAGALSRILTVLRGATVVGAVMGVTELVAGFFRAKAAAEEGDKAVARMLAAKPEAGAKRQTDEQKQAAEQAAAAALQAEGATRGLVASFDEARKSGDGVAEALKKVVAELDFSTDARLKNSAQALQQLFDDGKISAEQFREAWAQGLKSVDLAEFAVRAKTAFDATAEGARLAQQAIDAGLREAVRRAGLDMEVISGGMGKAAQAAVQGVDFMIDNLGRLKEQGADVARALGAALSKAIDTADSQAALDAVKARIEAVRAALGDKIADGLLQQAADKTRGLKGALDAALPGINSVAEAMKTLGVTSDAALKETAAKSEKAYRIMRESGTASARELSEAFKKYASDAIAANAGVASESIETEASLRGLKVVVDETGRASVVAMKSAADATRDYGRAVKDATTELEAQNAALEREIAAQEKAVKLKERAIALENARRGVDAEGYSIDPATGKRVVMAESQEALNRRVAQRYGDDMVGNADAIAAANLARRIDEARQSLVDARSAAELSAMNEELVRLERRIAQAKQSASAQPQPPAQPQTTQPQPPAYAAPQPAQVERRTAEPQPQRVAAAEGLSSFAGPITINVNGVSDPERVARQLQPHLQRLMRLQSSA